MDTESTALLRIDDLSVEFDSATAEAHLALDGVSLSISEGEIAGLVGESGSGKTVLSHSILGLLPENGSILKGGISWKGHSLLGLDHKSWRRFRGREIAMIFQDPQASLNPIYKVGKQMLWLLKLHRGLKGDAAREEALRLLRDVQLRNPESVLGKYAHELSGGMAQRVMIAMALGCRPSLLIADEPTSALDVTVQAEIAELLLDLRDRHQMAILFISHDIGLVSRLCDQIHVIFRSRLRESGEINQVLNSPRDSYTQKLLRATPFLAVAPVSGKEKEPATEVKEC